MRKFKVGDWVELTKSAQEIWEVNSEMYKPHRIDSFMLNPSGDEIYHLPTTTAGYAHGWWLPTWLKLVSDDIVE